MALTDAEHKRMLKLWANCFDEKGQARKDATTKEFEELKELVGRTSPQDPPKAPVKVKDYKPSEVAQQLLKEGASFEGPDLRNFGTSQKPVMVLREWFYRGKGKDRKAVFVQQGNIIEAGRTIAASFYERTHL